MTALTSPDWLTTRNGEVRPGLVPHSRIIALNGHPFYRIDVRPAGGSFTCVVVQANNGKRLDAGQTYPEVEAAFAGGLAVLREKLGW